MAGIQKSYTDALGTRRTAGRKTVRAIEAAMGRGPQRGQAETLVVREGDQLEVGPAALQLEDATSLTVDGTLPADLPTGYHLSLIHI